MPRKGSPYGGDYEKLRRRLLAGGKRCAYCSNPASTADHVPPLALHAHTGRGCCHLVPSCDHCRAVQGGLIRAGRFSELVAVDAEVAELVEPVGFDVLDPVWDVAWLDALRDVPASAVWPRLMTVPHPDARGSYGPKFERWYSSEFGLRLRWFQRLVACRLLEHDAKGRLLWLVLILTLARQLGKSTLLAAILMWRMIHGLDMFGEQQLVLHTARLTDAAREVQRPARSWAKVRQGEYKVLDANGKEAIEHLATGSRWLARAEDAAYGLSATTALADEAWDIETATVDDGIEPTLVEHVQPQLLLTSTAHRRATSLMLNRRAFAVESLDAPDDGTLLIEWSAPRSVDVQDRSAWRMASPHWTADREKRIARMVARALAGESVDPNEPDPVESVRSQWLNIWPVLSRRGKGEPLVDDMVWRGMRDVDLEPVTPLVLAVEDCFGRGASVAVSCMDGAGRVLLGGWCFESRDLAYRQVRSYVEAFPGSVVLVGALLKDDAELRDVPADVEPRGTSEARSALSLVRELVAAGRLWHDGSDVEGQMVVARVTPAPSGGLQLVNSDRFDLVRAAAWAVAETHRSAGLVPAVFGGPMSAEMSANATK